MNATMSLEKLKHYPVMLKQVLSIISPQHGGTFIDCTFGAGGYSKAILEFPNTKVIAFDRDSKVYPIAKKLYNKFPGRFNFINDKFSNISKNTKLNCYPKAIIFDLGISSLQLEDLERGFSFNSKSRLDMQMGLNEFSALDVVNHLDLKKLSKIIKILGEEKDGKKIANKIYKERRIKKLKFTHELTKIICSIKNKNLKKKIHPATKTFQAIRILVNNELTELVNGLISATKILGKGGILIVVNFHSLEDKIVKNFFQIYSDKRSNVSRYMMDVNNRNFKLYNLKEKKVIFPNLDELNQNTRSRSAKLRYAIRTELPYAYPTEIKKNFLDILELQELKP